MRCEILPETEGTDVGVKSDDIGYKGEELNEDPSDGVEEKEGIGEIAEENKDRRGSPLMTEWSEKIEKKEKAARRMGAGKTLKAMTALEALDIISVHLTVNEAQLFPTKRRFEKREMSEALFCPISEVPQITNIRYWGAQIANIRYWGGKMTDKKTSLMGAPLAKSLAALRQRGIFFSTPLAKSL